jgi:hypothetical protein
MPIAAIGTGTRKKNPMLSQGTLKAALTVFAAAAVAAGIATPLAAASAATGGRGAAVRAGASGITDRIFQRINGFKVCLDASFEFSVCQTSPNPDDPPAVQIWHLVPSGHGTLQIENGTGAGAQCLDLTSFTAPCVSGDSNQEWILVSAGNGADHVEHKSAAGQQNQCLDSMWTFKACSRGDKQQIWTLAHKL